MPPPSPAYLQHVAQLLLKAQLLGYPLDTDPTLLDMTVNELEALVDGPVKRMRHIR